MKTLSEVDPKEIIICSDCGHVWHLPTMMSEQYDLNKLFQEVKCLGCGNVMHDERREGEEE